jgi:GntR family transcriptional regulator
MREKLTSREDESTPLYMQLAKNLRKHIGDGGIDPGNAIPSERELSEMTGMSRVTIRKAIEQLIDEGLLFRKQGAGTFVAPRIEAQGSTLSGFSDDALRRGEKPGVIWMFKNYATPTEDEALALETAPTTKVARLGRVRLLGTEPLAIEHAVVPARFLPALDQLGDSLYAALGIGGFRPAIGRQRIRASLATPTEAAILSIQQNSEILRIERLTRLSDGTPVEFTRSAYRGDRYDFVSDLNAAVVMTGDATDAR